MPWTAVLIATVLAVAGKVGGSYLGGRLAGESAWTGLRLGVLLNTRGLTELVVLQAGYSAGILTPALYLALVAMALITTAMTGLTYSLIDRQVESPKVTVAVVEEKVPA
jgi:Kef-type K+ transport system membrane component KefB